MLERTNDGLGIVPPIHWAKVEIKDDYAPQNLVATKASHPWFHQ